MKILKNTFEFIVWFIVVILLGIGIEFLSALMRCI